VARLPAPRGNVSVHPNDAMMKRVKPQVMRAQGYVCWLCGHGPAEGAPADGLDHVVPFSECEVRGISPFAFSNLRAAHSRTPCRVCADAAAALGNTAPGRRAGYCNAIRGAGSPERCRQILANRTGLVIMGVAPSGGRTRTRASEPGERDW